MNVEVRLVGWHVRCGGVATGVSVQACMTYYRLCVQCVVFHHMVIWSGVSASNKRSIFKISDVTVGTQVLTTLSFRILTFKYVTAICMGHVGYHDHGCACKQGTGSWSRLRQCHRLGQPRALLGQNTQRAKRTRRRRTIQQPVYRPRRGRQGHAAMPS